jgi:hypothetical protein
VGRTEFILPCATRWCPKKEHQSRAAHPWP